MATMRGQRESEGDGEALWARGQALAARGRQGDRQAVALFRRGAALGSTSCLTALANHLDSGRGVRRDQAAARRLWVTAARRGDVTAAYNMGVSYKHEQRYREAMQWFERAAQLGDDSGVAERGKLRLFGLGVRRDAARGVADLEAAISGETLAQCEEEQAMLVLAFAYLDGVFVDRDYAIGMRWLERARRRGSEIAALWQRDIR